MKPTVILFCGLYFNALRAMEKTLSIEQKKETIEVAIMKQRPAVNSDKTDTAQQKEGWHIPGIPFGAWGSVGLQGMFSIHNFSLI